MDFQELVRKRFSARNYRPDEVETSKLDYILECARLAPSAVNFQPWKFLVIKSERQKENIRQCYDREWYKTAPLYHADVDASIAAEHICLAAAEVGLGSCWVCNFNPDLFAELFHMSAEVFPVAIIPLGYVNETPKHLSERKSMEEIVTVL